MIETIHHDYNEHFPEFNLEIVNVELDLNKTNDGTNFNDIQ